MRFIDRGLAVLLILGSIGHTFGVIEYYKDQPDALYWSLCATLLMLLVAGINLLRSVRPGDRGMAGLAIGATAGYFVAMICFGRLVGNMADPRVIGFSVICLGLIAFGIGSLRKA